MNTNVNDHSAAFGWVGILAAVAFCIVWLLCYQADGSWEWGVNAISDFGVSNTDAADYFNYGCVITGIILAIYGIGKLQYQKGVGYGVAGVLLAIAGICIVMIGIFTNDYHNGDYHDFFAILAAIFILAAVVACAVQQYYDGKVIPVGITMILVLAVILFAIALDFERFEVYSIVVGLLWLFIDGGLMIASSMKGGKQ